MTGVIFPVGHSVSVSTVISNPLGIAGVSSDLNHVCRAFNEHMGVYVRCQEHQLRFPPQEHVSGTYDVCALYMFLYS